MTLIFKGYLKNGDELTLEVPIPAEIDAAALRNAKSTIFAELAHAGMMKEVNGLRTLIPSHMFVKFTCEEPRVIIQ
jgi:hypothetical protein